MLGYESSIVLDTSGKKGRKGIKFTKIKNKFYKHFGLYIFLCKKSLFWQITELCMSRENKGK